MHLAMTITVDVVKYHVYASQCLQNCSLCALESRASVRCDKRYRRRQGKIFFPLCNVAASTSLECPTDVLIIVVRRFKRPLHARPRIARWRRSM
ncbi:hypothetical protein K439DRAFT_1069407 [Ramaria rubella]|nr:hypothetical protein K439DRAFT_1069407 [Ramaria rubella]